MALYSKEVMKHFKKPVNVGKIKNPDGMGKVGNLACLVPGQNIHVNNDLEYINKIPNQKRILSHDGKYHEVIENKKRKYKGKILILKNKLGELKLTPEHLVLAIKPPKGDKFLRTRYRRNLPSSWYHAGNLKEGDIILYPILKEEKNLDFIKFDIPKPKYDFKSNKLPDKITVNSDFLRLAGYFLTEGHVQDKPCRTFVSFFFNINEKELINDVRGIVKKLFSLDTIVRENPKRKTARVDVFSARLARFLKKIFNTGAANKTIPNFIMNLPAKKQIDLIYGLWKGDGCINLTRSGPRAGFVTISRKLAQQVKMLLLREKIIPSIYVDKKKKVDGVNHREAYRIHVGQRESLKRLAKILGYKYYPKSYISERGWFDDNYFYTPISRIQKQNYDGDVYNLEVKNSHTFVSEAFCVHNCGDIMYLYLTIRKNKKGQEIIKDIKFETFGCTVAVANTSLLTTMVKGKTIESALKITKNDLVKKFGNVPLIKVHCSLLAIDALAEAIYNYYKKNKKPISPLLQEKHEQAEKIGKEIEHRHSELIELEEELHKN